MAGGIRFSSTQLGPPARVKFTSQGVYITGLQENMRAINDRIATIVDSMPGITSDAMMEALKPIWELSQIYVPVKTGDLKRSGFVEKLSGHGGPAVAIGYGRYGRPWYAAYVHEATWMRHRQPTRAKFLESAVNERIHVFKAILQQSMQKRIGSRGRVR